MKKNEDSYPPLGILIATMMEAEPFITGLALKSIFTKPYRVYRNDTIILLISGIGKKAAELGTDELITRHKITDAVNLGAAGATAEGMSLGTVYAIDRVLDLGAVTPESPARYMEIDALGGFPAARLITADRPIIDASDRKAVRHLGELVDMEGASFLRICRKRGVRAHIFKLVSDTPSHGDLNSILGNIKKLSGSLYKEAAEKILPNLSPGHN